MSGSVRTEGRLNSLPEFSTPKVALAEISCKDGDHQSNVTFDGPKLRIAADHPWALGILEPDRMVVSVPTPSGAIRYHIGTGTLATDAVSYFVKNPCDTKAFSTSLRFVEPQTGKPCLITACVSSGSTVVTVSSMGEVGAHREAVFSINGQHWKANVWEHSCNTDPGWCGAALVSERGVIGFHIGFDARKNKNLFLAPGEVLGLTNESLVLGNICVHEARLGAPKKPAQRPRTAPARAVPEKRLAPRRPAPARKEAKGRPRPKGRRVMRARHENAIVGMTPAPSDYLGPMPAIGQKDHLIDQLVDQIVNPFMAHPTRLPDDNIRPTCTAKFLANRTYTVNTNSGAFTSMMLAIHSRQASYNTAQPAGLNPVYINGSSAAHSHSIYDYTPGNIALPIVWGGGDVVQNGTIMTGAGSGAVWQDDFGDEQETLNQWIASYRTLGMAARVRVIGLPTSQFMAPGKMYAASIRYDRTNLPQNEQDFVNLERLGQASHVSLDAVRASQSKTWFAVPDGVDKISFTSNFLPAPGLIETAKIEAGSSGWVRFFPGPTWPAGGGVGIANQLIPYVSAMSSPVPDLTTGSAVGANDLDDADNADSMMMIVIGFFGLQDGVVLEVDYAKIIEYIATPDAPAGLEACIQLPSHSTMDAVYAAAAILGQVQAPMFQVPGDATLLPKPSVPPAIRTEAAKRRVVRGRAVRKATGSLIKPNAESFTDFDWLKKGKLGDDKEGVGWRFT